MRAFGLLALSWVLAGANAALQIVPGGTWTAVRRSSVLDDLN